MDKKVVELISFSISALNARPAVPHAVSLSAGAAAIRRAHDRALPASRRMTTGEPFHSPIHFT